MSVPLDLSTHKTLILVKQIYQRAVIQSASHHSDVDQILSLISFDLANETLLKNAITAVDGRAKITSDLNELMQLADKVFGSANPVIPPVPDAQKIRRVRRIRNGAMHEAKYPTVTDINDCRTYTRDFLQQMIKNVWHKDFNAIRLTDVIKNLEIKNFLVMAEDKLQEEDYTESVIQAKAGFDLAFGRIKSSVIYRMPKNIEALVVAKNSEIIPSREALEALKEIRNIIAQIVVGLDYSSYRRYERNSKFIHTAYFGDGKISTSISGPLPTSDEAEYVVDFVINAVIQIESLIG